MKNQWKLRCLFIVLCLMIALYLGFERNMFVWDIGQEYSDYELVINEVMIKNHNSIREEDGDFEGWIEIYNAGESPENLKGFGLSNKADQPFLWTFPDIVLQPKRFLLVWASEKNKIGENNTLHTNFKLNTNDHVLILSAPNNNWKDIFQIEAMGENISYGRKPDGSSELYGFDGGTPGKQNESKLLKEGPNAPRLEGPIFSENGGFFTQGFDLVLSSNDPTVKIYYTLDSSEPTENSQFYTNPISIRSKTNEASIVRARAYKDGYPKSDIITCSYFVDKDIYNIYNTPIISVVTDPENLFDYEKGIYVAGKIFDQWKINNPNSAINELTPANYNQRGKTWEKEASIELFDLDGTPLLEQKIGIRIHGGYSRVNNIKSLSLFPRNDYEGDGYFSYDFFNGSAKNKTNNNIIDEFYRLILRTSASDSKYSFFRDALVQSLVERPAILDTQSSKPSIVFINGEYYGIHNIREAYDKNYIHTHYDINKEDVVIIKNPTGVAGVEIQEGYVGDEMHYNRLINFLTEHDVNDSHNYNFIKTQMDIDNFIEYNVLQIYSDNRDWPGNNVSIWRKRTQKFELNTSYGHDGRWRWLVYDLDYGFGLHQGKKAVENNTLVMATEKNGPDWPNPPWSTVLFRTLLENKEFKNQFINVFSDRLNTSYSSERVLDKINKMQELYYPNVPIHINRWKLHKYEVGNWLAEIEGMRSFAQDRPEYLRKHITEYFNLEGTAKIKVDTTEGGYVKINTLSIEDSSSPWEGIYFKGIPILVEAIPRSGYEFVRWEGGVNSQDRIIKIDLSQSSYLKAIFRRQLQ